MTNEYVSKATEIGGKCLFYLGFKDSKDKHYQKECKKIEKLMDGLELMEKIKTLFENEELTKGE